MWRFFFFSEKYIYKCEVNDAYDCLHFISWRRVKRGCIGKTRSGIFLKLAFYYSDNQDLYFSDSCSSYGRVYSHLISFLYLIGGAARAERYSADKSNAKPLSEKFKGDESSNMFSLFFSKLHRLEIKVMPFIIGAGF